LKPDMWIPRNPSIPYRRHSNMRLAACKCELKIVEANPKK
jgi:hypothetical protein